MALALQDRSWPHVNLWRESGVEGRAWRWYVTIGTGLSATGLQMSWTVDGRRREAASPHLEAGQVWDHPAFVDAATDALELIDRVGSIAIEWQDRQGLMRWRSEVQISEGASEGWPAPYGDALAGTASRVPFVNNGDPVAVW